MVARAPLRSLAARAPRRAAPPRRAVRLEVVRRASSEAASAQYRLATDLREIAAIWRQSCIIRARMLDRVMDASSATRRFSPCCFRTISEKPSPLLKLHGARRSRSRSRSKLPTQASRPRSPITTGSGRGPAKVLQGLREVWRAHLSPARQAGHFSHTRWSQDGAEARAD